MTSREAYCTIFLRRKGSIGPLTTRLHFQKRSRPIFKHDGAPTHFAPESKSWPKDHVLRVCWNGVLPGNNLVLNPIENFWAILYDRLIIIPYYYDKIC